MSKGAVSEHGEVACAVCGSGVVAELGIEFAVIAGACLAIRSIRVNESGITGPLCKRHAALIVRTLVEADDDGDDANVRALVREMRRES